MQLCNLTLRHGGSLTSTVMMTNVTPAEILILKRIHGDDATVEIRPTKVDKNRRNDDEWERLALKYDRASTFVSSPGEERKPLMEQLFPGVMKKLPTTLKEVGLGHLLTPAAIKAQAAIDAQRAAETAQAEVRTQAHPVDPDDDAQADAGADDAADEAAAVDAKDDDDGQ